MSESYDAEAVMVPLAQVAPHPANFRKVLADLDALALSIAKGGLDEPLVVMPADRVARAWPRHARALAGSAWVLLWGHRRLAAARKVFSDEPVARVPVVIRRDRVCDDPQAQLDLMTMNAIAHRSWNPVEEARAFQASVAAGRTQVETAELFGCHQSHVSGRLALLRLPAEIVEAVESGRLGAFDARRLARLDSQKHMRAVWSMYLDRREDAWITSIDQAIAEHADREAYAARRQAALAQAGAEGVRVVDPFEEFGREVEAHRLTSSEEVAAARAAGTLVAGISGDGELERFTTRAAVDPEPVGPDPDQRRAAAAARERAGRMLAAKPPAVPVTAAHMIDALLLSAPEGWRTIAQRWLRWLRLGPVDRAEPDRWWEQVCAADWHTKVWAAHCLALAAAEHHARTHCDWEAEDVAWVWRLVTEAGYVPRRWERQHLGDQAGIPST